MAAAGTEQLFTRGGLNAPDLRGGALVAKHAERMQKEKEEAGMRVVRALVPGLTPAVCAMALGECDYDGKAAATLLQRFRVDKDQELHHLHKEARKRKKAAEAAAKQEAEEAAQGGSSGSSSGSDSDSDTSGEDRKRKRRKKERKDKKKKKRSSSKREEETGKKAKRSKKEKKRSASKKKKKSSDPDSSDEDPGPVGGVAAAAPQFGKYGIIKDADLDAKRGDFMVWAMEVKKIDPETLPKYEEHELWRTYVEDYNTATFPTDKYYDVAGYEARKRARAAKRTKKGADGERTAFNDEAERRRELAEQRAREQQDRMEQAYREMKYQGKAQDMREQEMLRAQMKLAYRTGDHSKAEKLAKRLLPDDPNDPKAKKK